MKVNVNISMFVSLLVSPMREDELKAQDTAGSEIGSPSPSMPDFTLSWLLSSKRRNVSLIRISWRVPSVVSCFASLLPRGILKRLRVSRKLNAKDRRIRRVSLYNSAYSFGPLCATFMQHSVTLRCFASTKPYSVIKLSLREASE